MEPVAEAGYLVTWLATVKTTTNYFDVTLETVVGVMLQTQNSSRLINGCAMVRLAGWNKHKAQ